MGNIYLLDCTLRDGGFALEDSVNYVKSFKVFTKEQQQEIIKNLTFAEVDYIEIGAVEPKKDMEKTGFAIYHSIEDISKNIQNNSEKYAVFYRGPDISIDSIPNWSERLCKKARVCIRYSELEKSVEYCKELKKKGYDVFIQPMVTVRYSKEELNYLINSANEMDAFALSFVDSYGYMTHSDVEYYFNLFNEKLNKKIKIGFHSHNNMNMAFSNVQQFINLAAETNRDIIIDSTCLGMGQGAGNVQTELISSFLIDNFKKNYDYNFILDVCDEIEELTVNNLWGYSVVRLLPAINKTAYKFAIALREKYKLSLREINNILKEIPEEMRHRYSIDNIRKLLEINNINME